MKAYCASILALAALSLTGAAPQDDPRVEELEKRVAELEKRLATLEAAIQRMATQGLPKVQGAIERAIQRSKIASCANNLSQLWKMQHIYSAQFGGRLRQMPQETGPDFWLALGRTTPPLINRKNLDIYVCPLTDKDPAAGFTNYRGPSTKVQRLGLQDPVGCCKPGNHPDGTINVLLKSGDVKNAGPQDALYKKAISGTIGTSKEK